MKLGEEMINSEIIKVHRRSSEYEQKRTAKNPVRCIHRVKMDTCQEIVKNQEILDAI